MIADLVPVDCKDAGLLKKTQNTVWKMRRKTESAMLGALPLKMEGGKTFQNGDLPPNLLNV